MAGIWIAFTRAKDAANERTHADFLVGTRRDEITRLIPELDSYLTYREQLPDGDVEFLSMGRSETLSGAELQARIAEVGPRLSPLPYVDLDDHPPHFVFADRIQ